MKIQYVIEVDATWTEKDIEGKLQQTYDEEDKEKAVEEFKEVIDNFNNEKYGEVKSFFSPDIEKFYLRSTPKIYKLEINKVELDV